MTTVFTTQNFLPDVGGIQAYVSGLADALAARGHRIVVFCDSTSGEVDSCTDRTRSYPIERYRGPRPWRRWRKAVAVSDYLATEEVQAVVADTWKSLESLAASKLEGTKTVCLAHGAELLSYPNSRKGRRIREGLNKADLVAANSTFTAKLVSRFVEDASRIQVLWPGVSFPAEPEFAPQEPRSNFSPRLLTIARLDPYKGIDTVLRALPSLIGRYPRLSYDVIGTGEDLQRLTSLAKQLEVQRHVRFHGRVAEATKARHLRECDMFLLANREEPGEVEGFGIVLAEAGALRKPAITGRDGGTADVILHGRTGILVNGNDPSEVATAVSRLADNPDLANRMGNAAHERFEAEFLWENAVRRFEAVLYQ